MCPRPWSLLTPKGNIDGPQAHDRVVPKASNTHSAVGLADLCSDKWTAKTVSFHQRQNLTNEPWDTLLVIHEGVADPVDAGFCERSHLGRNPLGTADERITGHCRSQRRDHRVSRAIIQMSTHRPVDCILHCR